MNLYVASFVVFALVLTGMAVGVIFSGPCIRGSCGGVGNCVCGRTAGEEDGGGADAGRADALAEDSLSVTVQ